MAAWLNISIEALPFVAALGGWFALQWVMDPAAVERLRAFLVSLAGASASLFVATHLPSVWLTHPHDVINVAHLAGFAVAAAGAYAAVRPSILDVRARIAALAAVGVVSVAAMFAVDPHFLQAPFSSLDPLVRAFWYVDVDEGLPIWRIDPSVAATGLAQPLVGLAAGLFAVWKCAPEQRRGWVAYSYLMLAMTLASVFVIREATTASVMSLPGTAFLCDYALRRARNVSLMPLRVAGTTGAVLIMAPAYAGPALVMPADPRLITAMHSSHDCVTRDQLERLDQLPLSDLAVPLDMTPAVLASTHQRAIASGYHRNNAGIHDVILAFVAPLPTAQAVMAKRHIGYVVFCPNTPEAIRWSHRGPRGLAAALNSGHAPDWLKPVEIPGLHTLRVWKVVGGSRA